MPPAEAPNQIVFCERCDVAVHQHCYGIATVPDGEWLCEPCREYEEAQLAQGVPPVRDGASSGACAAATRVEQGKPAELVGPPCHRCAGPERF